MPEPPKLPPVATQPLSVVLLAHDAAAHLEPLVSAWLAFLEGLCRPYEVLLVDDGSRDGTGERAELLARRHPRLRALRHPAPRGEGAALRTALAEARHPLLFYTLCEPEYRPADLGRLLEKRLGPAAPEREIDHVHLISGYRAAQPVPAGWRAAGLLWRLFCRVVFSYPGAPLPGWLGWRGHAGRLLVRALFAVRYRDVACPFRLVRREIFARIPIQSDGPFAHVEVLAKANFLGHVLGEELTLEVRPRPYRGDWRAIWGEGKRVFVRPDFGPAVLPPPVSKGEAIAQPGTTP
jgi:glycosyltransferase involved in cell wall biosynthesis